MLAQVTGELLRVKPDLAGVAHQVGRLQRVLVIKEEVVHLPEGVLRRGGLRRLGRELGVRVDVGEREVTPDIADVAKVGEERADGRLGPAAVGALEVAVLHDRDRRRHRAADMVAVGIHRRGEIDDHL